MINPFQLRRKPDVLAIIPAYCAPAQLERCRQALSAQTACKRLEVYVRDNSEDNIYFTAAINEGLRYGLNNPDYRYFLLANQDCYFLPDALEILLAELEQNSRTGIAVPIQLQADDPQYVIWAGGLECFPYGRCYMGTANEASAQGAAYSTPWFSGAAALLRRDLVTDIGLLDGNMRFIVSDADYSLTARARGWNIRCVPKARCLHEHDGKSKQPNNLTLRNIMAADVDYFSRKWLSGDLFRQLENGARQKSIEDLIAEGHQYVAWLKRTIADPT